MHHLHTHIHSRIVTLCGLILLTIYGIGVVLAPGHVLTTTHHVAQSTGPHHGTAIYIIHLDRAKQRLPQIIPPAKALGWPIHIVHAIDGRKLSAQQLHHVISAKMYARRMHVGAIGCSLSHYKAYQMFLNSRYAHALILEDDAIFKPNVLHTVIAQVLQQPSQWDMISFNTGPTWASKIFTYRYLQLKSPQVTFQLPWTKHKNTGGYLINRRAAHQLLTYSLPIKMPLDLYNRRDWELGIVALESTPELVQQRHGISDRLSSKTLDFSSLIHTIRHGFFVKKTAWMRFVYHTKVYLSHPTQTGQHR